jgi:transcriptional regulator with PAS, ATPase and Fis domain
MSLDENIKRGEQLAKKLDKISSAFDITESSVDEMNTYISEALPMETTFETNPIELETEVVESVIKLSLLKEDFHTIRETLLSTVKSGRLILQSLADELIISDSERKSSMITSFAELTNAVNQSLKLLSAIYKDIISVQKDILTLDSKDSPSTVHNTQNNFISSTADIIKMLQNKE